MITDPDRVATAKGHWEQFHQPRNISLSDDDRTRELADYDGGFGLTGAEAAS